MFGLAITGKRMSMILMVLMALGMIAAQMAVTLVKIQLNSKRDYLFRMIMILHIQMIVMMMMMMTK